MDILQELSQSVLNLNSGQSLPAMLQRMLTQKSRELNALVEVNRALARSFDRDALFARIAAAAKTILGVDGVVLRLTRDDAPRQPADGNGKRRTAKDPDGESVSHLVATLNRPITIKNLAQARALSPACRELMTGLGWRSMAGAPLSAGGAPIGALVVCAREEREFHPDEIDFIAALADQAAIAAEKSAACEAAREKSAAAEKLAAELEQAHRAKAKFISAVSHELRTPLQVIVGSADLLKDGVVGDSAEEQAHFLGAIAHNAEALDAMIGSVLAVARSDAKETRLELSTVDVGEVMCDVLRYAARVNRNQLEFSWDVQEGLPPITTDVRKLEEILKHLIGNACKFTSEGSIDIRVRDLAKRRRLEFTVADSGIGVAPDDLDKIFDEFYQAGPARGAGMGLGLTIVKKYLDLMRGEISVASRPGRGATFTFTLPYAID